MKCAFCKNKDCYTGKDCFDLRDDVESAITDDDLKIMRVAGHIESSGYMKLNRMQELIKFCEMMNFKKIGIAFCIGLSEEAEMVHRILARKFDVVSVCCKICGIDKKKYSIDQIRDDRYEATCNPKGQAIALNREHTDLNIIVGLCIGHDILFTKYSDAPVTTLIVKDRVLAHNPAGAIYSAYHRKKLMK